MRFRTVEWIDDQYVYIADCEDDEEYHTVVYDSAEWRVDGDAVEVEFIGIDED